MSNAPAPLTSKPWPPPPDLHSIQELVATADVENFIADGSPADEYETEADELFATIHSWTTTQITAERLLPVLSGIWQSAFSYDDAAIADRRPALEGLAQQIARFFGPEAQPQVRSTPRAS
jgi:hypothetical protein